MASVNNKIDLSIIIVSYKSKDHLAVLLPSVFSSRTKYSYEVIVVDNGSNDGTVEFVESLKTRNNDGRHYFLSVIRSINNGFAAGNNIGIRQSSGKYILLLNPDTKVEPDTFEKMISFMESKPEVGISGCKIIKPDGKLDLACRRRFPNPWTSFKRLFLLDNRDYNYSDIDENNSMEVDSVVGAFLLIRKSVVDKIGLLDESFFMYGEDLDWCWRCKEAGFKVWYYPAAQITHYKGESSRKVPFKALKWFHNAMWIFYKKHYFNRYPFTFSWIVWLGIKGRMAALIIINLFKSQPRVSK
jgi:GT2 family glycosyltransferase